MSHIQSKKGKGNTIGGKNYKKGKKQKVEDNIFDLDKIKANPSEQQTYGIIDKKLGGSRMQIICSDNVCRNGIIPGNMKKKEWINVDDIVLVQINELSTKGETCYIIKKYSKEEIRELSKINEFNLYKTKEGRFTFAKTDTLANLELSDEDETGFKFKDEDDFDFDEL